ncbi:peptidase domain-containing ABC transporter [Brevibacillus borstelensis]|uniref:peptidase domain-containing ABC transporter n=1 Tax=Brevibacillus borstelensis TaxID=45462 RepID=UPI003CFADD8A
MFFHKTPFIEQMQQTECGLCCMAMVAGRYGSHHTLHELRDLSGCGRDGMTLFHMRQLSENLGFDAKVYRAGAAELPHVRLPAIAFWSDNHYVVIDQIKDRHVNIIDPAIGRKKLSIEAFLENYSGIVLEMIPTERIRPKKKPPVWRHFLFHLKESPSLLATVLLFAMIFQLVSLGIPMLVQYLIDDILAQNQQALLQTFMTGVLVLMLVQGTVQLIRGQFIIKLNNFLDKRLMRTFFSHILKVPYQFFQLRSFGDLLFRATSLRIVRDMMSSQLVLGVLDFGALLFISFYMFYKSPPLAGLVILLALLNVGITALSRGKLREKNQDEIAKTSQIQSYQTEFLYGIFGIKTAGIEKETYQKWDHYLGELIGAYRRKEGFLNIVNSLTGTMQIISPMLILWIGAMLVFEGNLSVGELVAFHALSTQFFNTSSSIVQTVNSVSLTTSYLHRIQDILQSPIEETPGNKDNSPIKGEIRLERVSFRYSPHSEEVIKDVSLHIKPGEKIAIVGQSGSGKSTLAKLILGLYMPTKGSVFYDGVNIKNKDLSALRKQIGVVPQDVTLFNRSIKDNISLYSEDVDIERIHEVAKMAQIYDDIQNMPMGFNTMISEMGMNISGGQRQRIALARALLNRPAVMLLDEATSSLDHQNEKKIDAFLRELKCTRIVIAHKLTSIMDADKIIVLEDGMVLNVGTHETLLNESKFYGDFYRKFLEKEQSAEVMM